MTVAYACDLNVYVCVNFGDEILLRGEECKTREDFNFLKNGKNSKIVEMGQGSLKIFLDLG